MALATPSVASAQAPTPVSPTDGQVFSWEEVETSGVRVVVQARPGLSNLQATVSRDAGLVSYADSLTLHEETAGRYAGTALDFIYDAEDAGVYHWQGYYYDLDPVTYQSQRVAGSVQSFSIRPRYRKPSLRVATRLRPYRGERYYVVLRYRAGSTPEADRLHLLATASSRCPVAPDASARSLLADAGSPAEGELETPIRYRRLGVFRLCGYVTSNGVTTARSAVRVEVVRPPVPKERMLRWRLSRRGLGPIRIGMTMSEIERVTGRNTVLGYGDYASCQQWSLTGAPGLSLMRAYGRLARVDAYRGRWKSSRGIQIGDPESKVRRRYGGVRSEPHPYTPPGKYLIVGGSRRRMIFETNPGGRVTSFRGGRSREVGYIEGCV